MTKDEALKLALEALETLMIERGSIYDKAIIDIKATLAQPEQEPVAWEQFYPDMGKPKLAYLPPTGLPDNACYIPPQRTWVGLTEDEILSISADCASSHQHMDIQFAKAIEAKLKAKNT